MNGLEFRRRIFHIVSGFIFVGLIYYDIINALIVFIIVLFHGLMSLISMKYKIPVIHWFLERLDRPKDRKYFPGKGSFYYCVGVLLAIVLFDKNVAMAGIMILALGDSIAPIVGQYGTIRFRYNKKKIVEGMIAGAIAGFIGALFFVAWHEALIASAAAMIAEGVGVRFEKVSINDNIIMPVVAGTVIYLLRSIL